MKQEIITYLESQQIGVIAIERLDGSPHGAAIHFAYSPDPLRFYFATHRDSLKVEALIIHGTSRATFVVGADESNMKTMQLDGVVELVNAEDESGFDAVFEGRFGAKHEKDEKQLRFTFTPTWWRFTDWTSPDGKLLLASDEKGA